MVNENSTPPPQENNSTFNKQEVTSKLKQAEKSIQMALVEVSLDEARLPLICSCITCAYTYLLEASVSTGRKRQW
jgi:hypothetical protein